MSALLNEFIDMLSYCRPHGCQTEEDFIDKFLRPLDLTQDNFGNLYKVIGDSEVIWSCHTDTVHRVGGIQRVIRKGNILSADPTDPLGTCLGADCTTGVWLMMQMIRREVPGLYIFHRGEECGGLGSSYIAKNFESMLKMFKAAIAFDRYGTTSIITHQMSRTCSDTFADSLIEQMPGYRYDSGGTFTDTANYADIIPECTNLSVGYYAQHCRTETQNIEHMFKLLNLMVNLDQSKLVYDRDPKAPAEYAYSGYGGLGHGGGIGWYNQYMDDYYYQGSAAKKRDETKDYPLVPVSQPEEDSDKYILCDLVKHNYEIVADILEQFGYDAENLADEITNMQGYINA